MEWRVSEKTLPPGKRSPCASDGGSELEDAVILVLAMTFCNRGIASDRIREDG